MTAIAEQHHHTATHAHHDESHDLPLLKKYLFSTDHKVIGLQFLFVGLAFMVIGGLLAMAIRWQLAWPNDPAHPVPVLGSLLGWAHGVMPADFYAMAFSMHASIMIFFVIIPLLVGTFGNYLIPLHIGARDMAFPFLNGAAFWSALAAGSIMVAGFWLPGQAAAAGWTGYPPLSDAAGASNSVLGMNLVLGGIFLAGFSSILGGLNFLVTIVKLRAPGMTWSRLPLVTWAQFITAVFQVLATPMLAGAGAMLLFDRIFHTSFFLPSGLVVIQQDERSQHKNKAKAMQVLRTRLYEKMRAEAQGEEAEARKAMVGSGDRSERIRTYNFPQGRVTDHRIGLTLHKLAEVLEGAGLGELIDALTAEDQAKRLAALDQ